MGEERKVLERVSGMSGGVSSSFYYVLVLHPSFQSLTDARFTVLEKKSLPTRKYVGQTKL